MGGGQPTTEQQAAIKAAQDAQNERVHDEQLASIAKAEQQKADDQKFYDENLSPEAQERAKEATEKNEKEDAALLGAVGTAIGATYLADRGGVSSLGMMAGPLSGVGLIASMLGFAPEQPAQNGPAPPATQNNNNFSFG